MSSPRGRRRRRAIFIAVAIAAVVVVVLVALVATGVLVLPSNTPAPVTITSVHLIIEEGTTASGQPWFVPTTINMTNGYPFQLSPGANWSVPWSSINLDVNTHSVYKVIPTSVPKTSPGTNFTIGGFATATGWVALPYQVPGGSDFALSIYVAAPNDPGSSFAVTLTVDTLSIS